MAEVRLDAMLRAFGATSRLMSEAGTVGGVLDDLEARYPRLRLKIRDETGAVRRFVRIFVNGDAIDGAAGLTTPLAPTDRVEVLHSIQGG